MNIAITDEFSDLPISRQRKYQLRRARDRRCTQCGEPVLQGTRCLKHLIDARERQREAQGLKRRYYGTLSYQLAERIARPAAAKLDKTKPKASQLFEVRIRRSRKARNREPLGPRVSGRAAPRGMRPQATLKPPQGQLIANR